MVRQKARGGCCCSHECMEGVQTVKEEREKSLKRGATAAASTLPLWLVEAESRFL